MNLVVGATGMVGSEVCRVLAASGKPVKALVRASADPSKVRHLEDLGATIAQGDLRDAPSLRAACRGVTHVVSTASSMPFAYAPGENSPERTDRDGAFNLIDAARGAGVSQFVYVSVPLSPIPFPLADAKRAVEARLVESGLAYTILRPTFFTEVWLGPALGFDYANRRAAIPGDGENAISWISFRDVALAAVEALDNPAARNVTLDLGGPQPLDAARRRQDFRKGRWPAIRGDARRRAGTPGAVRGGHRSDAEVGGGFDARLRIRVGDGQHGRAQGASVVAGDCGVVRPANDRSLTRAMPVTTRHCTGCAGSITA